MLELKKSNFENTILVGVINSNQNEFKLNEYLEELEFLTKTAGGTVIKKFKQKIVTPNPKFFIGKGKIEEIKNFVKKNEVSMVVFDDELSPTQQANIERFLKCKILDRTALILDIFSQRAKTSYAKTQVELAQYEYLLPRLKGLWTHLERQRGGIGMRGPGETEIETDRRIVRDKISLLKKKLLVIDKQMKVQRGNRGSLVKVALVGYTNVGKSTIMNLISKTNVFAEDKLFATLDTTVRKVVINTLPFLLTDTVGFIRKLPTQLIESFKSTLQEVKDADILLHIVDISHTSFEEHIDSVEKILHEINCHNKYSLMVFNKIDNYNNEDFIDKYSLGEENEANISLVKWKNTWMNKTGGKALFISAIKKVNIDNFKKQLYEIVKQVDMSHYPKNDYLYPEYFSKS
ncbi:MAG: GTPase HflX [Bacteroidota bacterium]|nr:GTPase HflX [Bacteroidota bacterium]MED5269614.1 GTPase HflX [Bacteroidota bacterium]|tara:strand:+ start:351 stop:1562 length:1212 start_codon:yes stop_codon:yes gene_type:complete